MATNNRTVTKVKFIAQPFTPGTRDKREHNGVIRQVPTQGQRRWRTHATSATRSQDKRNIDQGERQCYKTPANSSNAI